MIMFVCSDVIVLYCLSMNKVMLELLKGRPGCLLSLMAQGAEGCQQADISHICYFPCESNLAVKAWRGEAAALAPLGQDPRKKHTHADTHAHAHTHLENSNFPGAEVCGIKPELLWRKQRYSPSALRSVKAIIAASTGTHIQMGFTTWQRVHVAWGAPGCEWDRALSAAH